MICTSKEKLFNKIPDWDIIETETWTLIESRNAPFIILDTVKDPVPRIEDHNRPKLHSGSILGFIGIFLVPTGNVESKALVQTRTNNSMN